MNRRIFLGWMGLGGAGGILTLLYAVRKNNGLKSTAKNIFNKIKPENSLSEAGNDISVETALNSRCTSDFDDNKNKFHWGKFDTSKKYSEKSIQHIIDKAVIPRYTKSKIHYRIERDIVTLYLQQSDPSESPIQWQMIECGMKQQAICLVCAAYGAGMVFRNLGKDGKMLDGNTIGIINMRIIPMHPAYGDSYWTEETVPVKAEINGNEVKMLPVPESIGGNTLFETLKIADTKYNGMTKVDDKILSQLLWAARGRTPHLYKGKKWGMTIPTWAGEQNITSVYLLMGGILYRYVNWAEDKSNHYIEKIVEFNPGTVKGADPSLLSFQSRAIILSKNESMHRSSWEIGYQLLNLILQGSCLNISFGTRLIGKADENFLTSYGISNLAAIFTF